jgi:hypothetical protein
MILKLHALAKSIARLFELLLRNQAVNSAQEIFGGDEDSSLVAIADEGSIAAKNPTAIMNDVRRISSRF